MLFSISIYRTLAYTWRGGKEKGEDVRYGAMRHRKIERAAQRTKGKRLFPAAVTEVPRPSLSCGHGLRSWVFLRRHLSENGLVCHATSGNGRARRFEDRKHMTAGNGRRCRFTLAVSCIRRHFRLPIEAKKRKNPRVAYLLHNLK